MPVILTPAAGVAQNAPRVVQLMAYLSCEYPDQPLICEEVRAALRLSR